MITFVLRSARTRAGTFTLLPHLEMSCTESCDISKWTPPTPQSVLIPLPSKQLQPPALDLPEPSLLTSQNCPYDEATWESHAFYHRQSSSELARLLNPNLQPSCTERATPGSLIMPQAAGTAAGDPQPMRRDIVREVIPEASSANLSTS